MGTKSKMGMSIAVHPEDGTHEVIAETWAFAPGPGQYQPNALIKNENKGQRFGEERRKGMANAAALN